MKQTLCFLLCLLLLGSCYYSHPYERDRQADVQEEKLDSIDFFVKHHYWKGYNFVASDSIPLQSTLVKGGNSVENVLGEMSMVSTMSAVEKKERLVVADIQRVRCDTVDAIWLKVVTESAESGWVEERELLKHAVPDDPISRFIYNFSQNSVRVWLSVLLLGGVFVLVRTYRKQGIRMVHFNDISSSYPMALCAAVAIAATIYGSIQKFVPDTWVEFYFYPTLNPFNTDLPLILSLFIAMVWILILLSGAVLEDVYRNKDLKARITYLIALAGVCAVLYAVFTLSVHIYIGYPLLLAYLYFCYGEYQRKLSKKLLCGHCGKEIERVGKCPHCGVMNE